MIPARWAMAADRLLDRARRNGHVAHPPRRRPRHPSHRGPGRRDAPGTRPGRPLGRQTAPSAGVQEQLALHRAAGRRPALEDDAGGEDRPDDPGRADRRRRQPVADHDERVGQHPVRRRVDPGHQHARGVGRHGRPLPGGGARDAAGHPHPVRRRHRPRPRQPAGRHRLPPQHRPRRHPRPGPRRGRRAHRRDRDAGDRTAVGVRPVRLRGPRRPVGPHLRELRGGPEAGGTHGDRDRRAPGQRRERPGQAGPRAGQRQALRRRRPDDLQVRPVAAARLHRRPGHRPGLAGGVRAARSRAVRPRDQEAPCRLRHAVLLQRRLDRGRAGQPHQDAREPGAHHGLAQAAAGVRRDRHLRLAGDPAAPGHLHRPGRALR